MAKRKRKTAAKPAPPPSLSLASPESPGTSFKWALIVAAIYALVVALIIKFVA